MLGASPKPDRYSNQAVRLLASFDYRPIPVNPAFDEIEGLPCFPNLAAIGEPVHTITLYLGPARSTPLIDEILAANPQRIILNPGRGKRRIGRRGQRCRDRSGRRLHPRDAADGVVLNSEGTGFRAFPACRPGARIRLQIRCAI